MKTTSWNVVWNCKILFKITDVMREYSHTSVVFPRSGKKKEENVDLLMFFPAMWHVMTLTFLTTGDQTAD